MPPETNRPNDQPPHPPERKIDAGLRDSFPASDASADTGGLGSVLVPPQEMMNSRAEPEIPPNPSVRITVVFRSQEAAKLALDSLVREGPLDRRLAEMTPGADDSVTLSFTAPPKEGRRMRDLLEKQGGAEG